MLTFRSFDQNDSLLNLLGPQLYAYQFELNDSFPALTMNRFSKVHSRSLKEINWEKLDEALWEKAKSSINPKLSTAQKTLQVDELKIFPEKNNGLVQLSFKLPLTALPLTVQLVNVKGHTIYANHLPQEGGRQLFEIDLRSASRGTYFLVITHGKARCVQQLNIN
jgi:hypothetical protein